MPFCEECDRHWTPTSMRSDGSCPTCGRLLEAVGPAPQRADEKAGEGDAAGDGDAAVEGDDGPHAPWHFKLLLVGLVIYLSWRGVQGVEWLAHKI